MRPFRILLSFFLMFLFFTACSGGGGSGSSSSAPITDGSGSGGGDMIDTDPVDGGNEGDMPDDGTGNDDGDEGDIVDDGGDTGGGDDTVGDGGGTDDGDGAGDGDGTVGDGGDTGGGDDTVGGGDDTDDAVQACNPLMAADLTLPFKNYTARSTIQTFASVGPTFIVANSDSTVYSPASTSRGKLEYWDASTLRNRSNENIWAPSSSQYLYGSFKNPSYCFDGMQLTARDTNANIVCVMRTSRLAQPDQFLMFNVYPNTSTPEVYYRNPIASMNQFSSPLFKRSATALLGNHHHDFDGGMFDRRVINSVNIQTAETEELFSTPSTLHIGGRGSDGADYGRATKRTGLTSNSVIPSIPLVWHNRVMALSLYKHPSQNSYVLSLSWATSNSVVHVESAVFSPSNSTLELSRIIWTDAQTHKIYILGEKLKEIFVFNLSTTTVGPPPFTVSTHHITLRASDGHFSVPTTGSSSRSVDKALVIGNFIFTLGENPSDQNAVIAIKTVSGIDSAIREATFFETGFFESGTTYLDPRYDLKSFKFGSAEGIVLKKDRELKLYRYSSSLCQ